MKRLIGHIPGPKPNAYFGNIPDVLAKKGDYGRGFDQYIPKYGEVVSLIFAFLPRFEHELISIRAVCVLRLHSRRCY